MSNHDFLPAYFITFTTLLLLLASEIGTLAALRSARVSTMLIVNKKTAVFPHRSGAAPNKNFRNQFIFKKRNSKLALKNVVQLVDHYKLLGHKDCA